jgi:hypothetical protein
VINLLWLVLIVVCAWQGWTNGLLAIIAITLMEATLLAGKIKQGLADLYEATRNDLSQDDEPSNDSKQAVTAAASAGAYVPQPGKLSVIEGPTGTFAYDWTPTKES